jgi:hypothetical protein
MTIPFTYPYWSEAKFSSTFLVRARVSSKRIAHWGKPL